MPAPSDPDEDVDPIFRALDACQVRPRDVLRAALVTALLLAVAWAVRRCLS